MTRRWRLWGSAVALALVVALAGALTGVAVADVGPSATASHTLTGTATTVACNGTVSGEVTITGQPGSTGEATAIALVLDGSGSMGSGSKLAELVNAAKATLTALDAADGAADEQIAGNTVGIVRYSGSSATVLQPVGSTYADLVSTLDTLPTPSGGSPHAAGINAGATALGATGARAMVLISDGEASGSALTAATTAATTARTDGIRIESIGIGSGAGASNLQTWAYQSDFYQSGSPGPIDTSKLLADLGALVVIPVQYTLTETLGSTFSSADPLSWSGSLVDTLPHTFAFTATRNGVDPISVTEEIVSTLSLTVTGGTATVTPPADLTIDVLPCGGTALAATTCSGGPCTTSGSQGGVQYSVNAGAPAGTTDVFLTGFTETPPAGACTGFTPRTGGVQFDIRPLTTDASFQMVIPKAALGTKKWWQTQVCFGTNLKFTTAISSLANLRPGATPSASRWWGLLPSIPRLVKIDGLGWIWGPWITGRSVRSNGDAVVTFKIPFVPGSAAYTTDGKPGYDPKMWGGG